MPDGLSGSSAVQPHLQKYFRSGPTQIKSISAAVPPHMRGVSRSSRTLGAGCGGRGGVGRAMGSQGGFSRERSPGGRTTDACRGRRSRVVLTPRRRRQVSGGVSARPGFRQAISADDGDNTSPITGESTKEAVKTIRVRECRVNPAVTVVTMLVCFVLFRTRGCGCGGHPAFPTPSAGEGCRHDSGALRRGDADSRPELLGCLKLNRSFRDGAPAPDPESRDSGFDALHRPGMTTSGLLRRCAHTCACSFRKPYSRRRSQSSRRCDRTTRCSSDKRRCRRNPRVRRTAALEFAASHWPRISRWP